MKQNKWRLLSLIAVLALIVAACGGEDAADTTDDTGTTETTAEALGRTDTDQPPAPVVRPGPVRRLLRSGGGRASTKMRVST